MMKLLLITCALVAAICHQTVLAQELKFGSKAPKLEVKKFIKGEEVKAFEKGKIYVVELWATWCPPCRDSIPHLTELQKKFKDVTFIGVAVLQKDQSIVPDFVADMGKKMDYRVALDLVPDEGDPEDGKTVQNWMAPSETPLPTAFVVNGEGKIAWIGHPMLLEEPLGQIVEGKWDIAAEAKKVADEIAQRERMAAIFGRLQKLHEQFAVDGQPDELLSALDSAVKEVPDQLLEIELLRFQVLSLVKERTSDALETVNRLLASEKAEDPQFLDSIAWIIVRPDRDTKADPKLVKLALKVAIKADNLTNGENASVADTLAKAYFDNGEPAKAVKTQERVLELAEGTAMAQDASLQKRLRQYKKAMDAAATKDNGAGSGDQVSPAKKSPAK